MQLQIELLAKLQIVDRSLRDKTRVVQASETRVAEIEEALRTRSAEAAVATQELQALATRQRDLETRLAANETKLKDRRMRITRIRNEKELGLAKREVDILKDETSTLETQLVEALEQVEASTAKVKSIEDEIAALEAAMATEAAELRGRIDQYANEMERERESRTELLATIPEDLRRRYEMIFSRRDGLAVAEIRDGTCQGCHMNVPPQLFNQIQRREQVILCPSCQRILYWRSEPESASE